MPRVNCSAGQHKHTGATQGPICTPFDVDCHGRWGREAGAWASMVLKDQPKEQKATLIHKLWVGISVAVQAAVVAPLICAARVPPTATPCTGLGVAG